MKRFLALGLSTVLSLPVLSVAVVRAQTNNSGSSSPPTETEKPLSADELKQLQTRLEKRKAELKIKLTNAEKLSIQNKCKAAQGFVSSVKGRVKGIETSRTEVYGNILDHLTDLSAKLKNKGIDTKTLDGEITTLQDKIQTFNTDLATYKQAVSDLAAMDCKADADGFKASLQAARTALETVNKDSQAVRSYVKDTIKPSLKTIRGELETKTGEGQ